LQGVVGLLFFVSCSVSQSNFPSQYSCRVKSSYWADSYSLAWLDAPNSRARVEFYYQGTLVESTIWFCNQLCTTYEMYLGFENKCDTWDKNWKKEFFWMRLQSSPRFDFSLIQDGLKGFNQIDPHSWYQQAGSGPCEGNYFRMWNLTNNDLPLLFTHSWALKNPNCLDHFDTASYDFIAKAPSLSDFVDPLKKYCNYTVDKPINYSQL